MSKPLPCANCIKTRDSPIPYPVHVVHPLDGTPRLWNVSGEAICPACGTRWRHNRVGGRAEIVA